VCSISGTTVWRYFAADAIRPWASRSIDRLQGRWPNLVLVRLRVHASWRNQIEIYFSILQRTTLTPRHSASLTELNQQIMGFQAERQKVAKPIDWRYTRRDLNAYLARLTEQDRLQHAA